MARSSVHTTDSKRYFDWLFQAKLDVLAAEVLMTDERCYNAAAFHCQQSIEKALKAYLLYETHRLFDGHNLTWLCKQAVERHESFSRWLSKSAALNRYYIETRYPSDIGLDVDTETINALYKDTDEMLEFISGIIRFDFQRYRKKKRR